MGAVPGNPAGSAPGRAGAYIAEGMRGRGSAREVAPRRAVPVQLDRQPARDAVREGEVGHVGPPPRAVDGEEAEAGELEAVEVVVHVRDPLVGLFCRAVERRLLVDAMLLRKGNLAEEGEGRRER